MSKGQREKLLDGLDISKLVGVEIGALDKPRIRRSDGEVIYVDYTDKETLAEKYKNDPAVDVNKIVDVDAIWGANTLVDAVQGRKVDYVVASHVIEHVPDLITWLSELRSILKDTGEVRLIVPDRRFSFDYLREETRFADVLQSYLHRARVPQPHPVLDFLLNAAVVDCSAAWQDQIVPSELKKWHSFEGAMNVAQDVVANGTYHDVHCWVFTPKTFARLFGEMADAGLVDFACERFYDTAEHTLEFFVSLRPSNDRAHIADSWKRMAEEAVDDVHGREAQQSALIARREADLIESQQQYREAVVKIASLNQLVGDMQCAQQELQEKLSAVQHQLQAAQHHVLALESSTSWRMTAPLRSVITRMRGRVS